MPTFPNLWITCFPYGTYCGMNDFSITEIDYEKGLSWSPKYVRRVKERIYSRPSLFREISEHPEKHGILKSSFLYQRIGCLPALRATDEQVIVIE